MYKNFFHLTSEPFNLTPDSRFYFSNPVHQGIYEKLLQLALQRGDYVALIGNPGTGKTTLLKRLMEEMNSSFCCVFFEYTNFSFEGFLAAILNKLNIAVPEDACSARFDALIVELAQQKRTLLLLLDEAQNIPSDSLRQLLSHLERLRYQGRMIEVIMAGQPELEIKLDAPVFSASSRCFVARYQLSSLNVSDTGEFIFHRLKMSGCPDPDLISAPAIEAIGVFTQGNPRLINMVCDRILVTACERSVKRVDAALAGEVIAALKEYDPEGFLRFFQDQLPAEAAATEPPGETVARPSPVVSTASVSRQTGRRRYLAQLIGPFQGLYRSALAAMKSWVRSYRESWVAGSTAAVLLVVGLFVLSPGDRQASDMVNSAQATEGLNGIVMAQRKEIAQLEDMQLTLNMRLDDAVRQQAQLLHEVERLKREALEGNMSTAEGTDQNPQSPLVSDQLPLEKQQIIGQFALQPGQPKIGPEGQSKDTVLQSQQSLPATAILSERNMPEAKDVVAASSMNEAKQEAEANPPVAVEIVATLTATNADGVDPESYLASGAGEIDAEQQVDARESTAFAQKLPIDSSDAIQALDESVAIATVDDRERDLDESELTGIEQIPLSSAEGIPADSAEVAAMASVDMSGSDVVNKGEKSPTEVSVETSEVDDLLAEAALLMQARYLTTPADRNALRLYQRVLKLAAGHPEAKAGIESIARQYTEWGNQALDAGDTLNARNYYSKGLLADPESIALKQKLQSLDQLEPRVAAQSDGQARKQLASMGLSVSKEELLASAERGDPAATRLLLEAGISPNAKNPDGWTALLYTAVHGNTDVARILLANGANPNNRNNNGETALTAASWNGHTELVDLLLKAGARVDDRNGEGWTPLMGAALNGHLAVVKRLLAQDARIDISDGNGWDAMTAATREGHDDIALLLKQAKST